jgi:rhodanese-related sulfurtransferase
MAKALSDFVDEALTVVDEMEADEAKRLLDDTDRGGWHFVDVREPDEYAAAHIPSARSFPRGFLEVKADLVHPKRDSWLEDRKRPMILYCGGGHRSALATRTLLEMGFNRVVSLRGGFAEWVERKLPVER